MAVDLLASDTGLCGVPPSGVYEILNTVNGKRYIGQTSNLKARWREHRKTLRGKRHPNKHLQAAWNKYGEAAFKFLPILTCSVTMLDFYEQQLLDKVSPEYNIAKDVRSPGRGCKMLLEHKEALRERMKGNKYSLGAKHPPEQYESRAIMMRGNTHTLGFKHTPEFCALRSQRMIGNTCSRGKNLGNKNSLGFKFSPEQNAAKSIRQTGKKKRPHTPEARERISQGMKEFRQRQRDARS